MTHRRAFYRVLICVAVCGLVPAGRSQSVSNYAVQVSATVQTNPALITLFWPADPGATGYAVYRKSPGATLWGNGTSLLANATSYADSNVVAGGAYEYRVSKSSANYWGEGYIYAGIKAPLVENRGKVILLVDSTWSSNLVTELARLQQDLVGDGWTVLRHDVGRGDAVTSIKGTILADYNGDPANVGTLFLFGHVPVPYSGDLAPDGHVPEHQGAWPADVYYADMVGDATDWTDSLVNDAGASDPRNRNVPGDGKFDPSTLPYSLDLEVGRVDLANLPAFSQGEGELLRQYLNKDHSFRHRLITAERRGLIDDNFGVAGGEAFAVNGWRNFAPLFGASNSVATADWFGTLANNSYLWGYGCGPGTYTSASGVGSTTDFAANDPRVVFTMLFGSYFGDWDSPNNFLRAGLATPTYTLTCAWAGRPHWAFHHMALGETIGFSARWAQNNSTTYDANAATRFVHIALMGDPTLRMHVVAPPSALLAATNNSGGVVLSWNPAPDVVAGYRIYSSATSAGPFMPLTSGLISGTNYTDPSISTNVYMVRAVKLEVSASGSYSNASQGIFQSLDGTAGAPSVNLFQPTNQAVFGVRPNIQLSADTFDPANCVTKVAFYANGVKIGETNAPPYTLFWTNVPGGSYSITALATCSSGITAQASAVKVQVDNGGSPNLILTRMGTAVVAIRGDEALGRVYRIQFVPDLRVTNWQSLGTATGTPSGFFQIIDSNGVPQRCYRSVYP